jgi:transcription factor 1
LQPRRHLLVENKAAYYGPFLKELTSKPSVKLLEVTKKYKEKVDWTNLVTEHLPQSVPPGEMPLRNDNLLVIANLTDPAAGRGGFTPSRTLMATFEDCLRRTGIHSYGMVRMLVVVPPEDAELLIPRAVINRKKVALLNESLALRFFNVAETGTNETNVSIREWDLITKSAARVGQRTADANITIPEGRERPSIPLAPEYSGGRVVSPYIPRARLDMHQDYIDAKEEIEKIESGRDPSSSRQKRLKELQADIRKRRIQLNQDNQVWHRRLQWADRQSAIESLERDLVQAVADPAMMDAEQVQELDSRIARLKSEFAEQFSREVYRVANQMDNLTDNRRAALSTGNLDDATLLWDRRPFEPLYIKRKEDLWPVPRDCAILYFEPDPHSFAMQAVSDPEGRPQQNLVDIYMATISALGLRGTASLADICEKMFPGRPAVDIIKAIPGLIPHVSKQLRRPDYHLSASENASSSDDGSSSSLEDKFTYDLTTVRLRSLPISVITALIREYMQWPGRPETAVQVNRSLGGSMTTWNAASEEFTFKAGRAAGKVNNL